MSNSVSEVVHKEQEPKALKDEIKKHDELTDSNSIANVTAEDGSEIIITLNNLDESDEESPLKDKDSKAGATKETDEAVVCKIDLKKTVNGIEQDGSPVRMESAQMGHKEVYGKKMDTSKNNEGESSLKEQSPEDADSIFTVGTSSSKESGLSAGIRNRLRTRNKSVDYREVEDVPSEPSVPIRPPPPLLHKSKVPQNAMRSSTHSLIKPAINLGTKSIPVLQTNSVNAPTGSKPVASVMDLSSYRLQQQPVSLLSGNIVQQPKLQMVVPMAPTPLPVPTSNIYHLYLPPSASTFMTTSLLTAPNVSSPVVAQMTNAKHSPASSALSAALTKLSKPQSSVQFTTSYNRDLTNRINSRAATHTVSLASSSYTSSRHTSASKPPPIAWVGAKSSWDMIEAAKFEAANKIYNKQMFQKHRPDAEMGPLAKFLFDLGLDNVKESVYNELIKIQSKRKDQGRLNEKEENDFKKLQEVHQEVRNRVGHLRLPYKKRCSCGFRTDLDNVMVLHKEYPHLDGNDMRCCYCTFGTRLPVAFKFHMEVEHNMRGQVDDRSSFWQCPLCPYDHNVWAKMKQHKMRCWKNFKLNLNLHPSCLYGMELNYCLETVFYKSKHALAASRMVGQSNASNNNNQQKKILPKSGTGTITAVTTAATVTTPITTRATPINVKVTPVTTKTSALNARMSAPVLKSSPITGPSSVFQSAIQIRPVKEAPVNKLHKQYQPPVVSKTSPRPSSAVSSVPVTIINTNTSGPTKITNKINNLISNNNQVLQMAGQQKPINSNFEICEICGGYVKDKKALRIHFYYAHRIDMPTGVFERLQPPLYCATCFVRFWTAQGLQKHIEVHKEDSGSAGVAGKCIICGHRVPNILMHMRIVHNRDLNTMLKGFKCVFCGSYFSGQSPMENHMATAHGVVVKISGGQATSTSGTSSTKDASKSKEIPKTNPVTSNNKPAENSSGSQSNNQLVKGSVCVLCNLNFGRNVDLTRHCMRVHHTCMKCGMVVADKESLEKHVCLMSPAGLRDCEFCSEKAFHPAYYVKHLRDKHLKKCTVNLAILNQKTIDKYSYKGKLQKRVMGSVDDSRRTDQEITIKIEPSEKNEEKGDVSVKNEPTEETEEHDTTKKLNTDLLGKDSDKQLAKASSTIESTTKSFNTEGPTKNSRKESPDDTSKLMPPAKGCDTDLPEQNFESVHKTSNTESSVKSSDGRTATLGKRSPVVEFELFTPLKKQRMDKNEQDTNDAKKNNCDEMSKTYDCDEEKKAAGVCDVSASAKGSSNLNEEEDGRFDESVKSKDTLNSSHGKRKRENDEVSENGSSDASPMKYKKHKDGNDTDAKETTSK